jgi:hypothetical protein
MPLGFAKDILTKGSSAIPFPAYTDGTSATSANKAAYIISYSSGPFTNVLTWSCVVWVRAGGLGSLDTNDRTMVTQVYRGGATDPNSGMNVEVHSGYVQCNLYNQIANRVLQSTKSGGPYDTTAKFQNASTGFLNGKWHCIMVAMDLTGASNNYFYIDGVDVKYDANAGSDSSSTTRFQGNTFKYIPFQYNHQKNDTTLTTTGTFNSGVGFNSSPCWIYDSTIDFSNSTVRDYYYNSSNTDGFVDPGSDGTAGGATAADFFVKHSATTMTVGSTAGSGATVNTATIGTGAITVLNEGPGSGDAV